MRTTLYTILLATVAGPLLSAQLQRYKFKLMFDSTTGAYLNCERPTIDASGRVVFGAAHQGGLPMDSLLRSDGTTTEVLATIGGPIVSLRSVNLFLQSRAGDSVIFGAVYDTGEDAVLKYSSNTLTEVFRSGGLPTPSLWQRVGIVHWAMNGTGSVACIATGNNAINGDESVVFFKPPGGTPQAIAYGNASFHITPTVDFGYLDLLDDNSLIFTERRWDYLGGRNLTWIASSGLELASIQMDNDPSFSWSATNSGYVIRTETHGLDTNFVGGTIGGAATMLISNLSCSGPVVAIGPVSMNDRMEMAIEQAVGTCANAHSLVTVGLNGNSGVINRGDHLFGRTVQDVLIGLEAINDAGQIALRLNFTDNSVAIVRADPRPWAKVR